MLRKSSQLNIKSKRRNGERISGGTFKSERNYIDFVIDGISLSEIVRSAGHDLVSVFTKEWVPEEREKSLRRLLLLEPADFPNNRRSIMVCAECGDLGCGALSILVESSEEEFVWRDFGYENNYEEELHVDGLRDLGPFHFESRAYKEILADAMLQLTQ